MYSDRIGIPAFSTLRELSHRAICSGLESTAVRIYLREMGFDTSNYQPIAPEIERKSTIVEPEARKIRLEQASRLRKDLKAIAV